MAEYEVGIADMLGVLDGDRGGGGIAEPMWRQADAEGAFGVYANAPRHGAVLTPQQNGPVALDEITREVRQEGLGKYRLPGLPGLDLLRRRNSSAQW
jgi:hypothetical protein